MLHKVELFLFALSIFYNADIITRVIRNMFATPPVPVKLNWIERGLWGVSLSYILTYILT